MAQTNKNIEFKSIKEYLEHWDKFFKKWEKDPEATFEEDVIWSKHKGKEWETEKGKKRSTKLEPDVFPQPYLGNIDYHSVITLNLNPSRSKKYGYENFKEPDLNPKYKYKNYAKGFPTYYTHPFWEKQDGWIDGIFENLGKDAPSEKEIKPFSIEICPWGSKSWLGLGIKKESKKINNLDISTIYFLYYLNNFVFDVIEKVIDNSKLKIVLSVGKAYYDIFEHKESGFRKIIECTKSQNSKAWDLKLDIDDEIKAELNKSTFKKVWPKKKENNEDLRYVNRSFSFWKKNGVIYFNSWSPGSNKPPGKEFDKIEKEFFRIYKSLINKYQNKQ